MNAVAKDKDTLCLTDGLGGVVPHGDVAVGDDGLQLEGRQKVRGTGSTDPQEILIFWELLIFRIINVGLKFLVTRKRLTYHAAITDGIACRPLDYGVWNACKT